MEVFTNLTFCLSESVSCLAVPTSLDGKLTGTCFLCVCVVHTPSLLHYCLKPATSIKDQEKRKPTTTT